MAVRVQALLIDQDLWFYTSKTDFCLKAEPVRCTVVKSMGGGIIRCKMSDTGNESSCWADWLFTSEAEAWQAIADDCFAFARPYLSKMALAETKVKEATNA